MRTTDAVLLSPYGSALQIEYAALNLAAAAKPRFRYRLEGWDSDWSYAGERKEASYTNLPRGNYRFRVTATNDGLWKEPEAAWDFSVGPAFYQTRLFYLACVLSLITSVYLSWRLRLRAIGKQYSMVLAERMRVSREIHDTLLQSLGAVGLELEVVARRLSSTEAMASDALRRLQVQVARCIKDTRQSVWDLRSPGTDSHTLDDSIRELITNATRGKNIRTSFTVSGGTRPCAANTEEELLRIGREAINNAVRHAQPEQIRVELEYHRRSLTLRVVDDGCGFTPVSDAGEHCGLLNMRERAARCRGRLDITSAPDRGTVIEAIVRG
jgi:signal transduction histidine kinase